MRFKILMLILFFSILILNGENTNESRTDDALAKLTKSLNEKNYSSLEPFLSTDYRVKGAPEGFAKEILRQVINQYNEKIDGFKIKKIDSKNNRLFVSAAFIKSDGIKDYNFVLDAEGKFVEIGMFEAMQANNTNLSEETESLPIAIQASFKLVHELILTKAELNGEEGYFILDSGSPRLIINSKSSDDKKTVLANSSGIGGNIGSMDIIEVNSFKWFEYEQSDFDAISIDLSHLEKEIDHRIFGLIGQDLMEPYETFIDYEKSTILMNKLTASGKIENQENYTLPKPDEVIKFKLSAHIPVVKCTVGKNKFSFGIDTGAQTNLIDPSHFSEIKEDFTSMGTDTLTGADSTKSEVEYGIVKNMKIGKIEFSEMKTVISDISHLNDGYGLELAGLLGYPFLNQQKFSINYRTEKLSIWKD